MKTMTPSAMQLKRLAVLMMCTCLKQVAGTWVMADGQISIEDPKRNDVLDLLRGIDSPSSYLDLEKMFPTEVTRTQILDLNDYWKVLRKRDTKAAEKLLRSAHYEVGFGVGANPLDGSVGCDPLDENRGTFKMYSLKSDPIDENKIKQCDCCSKILEKSYFSNTQWKLDEYSPELHKRPWCNDCKLAKIEAYGPSNFKRTYYRERAPKQVKTSQVESGCSPKQGDKAIKKPKSRKRLEPKVPDRSVTETQYMNPQPVQPKKGKNKLKNNRREKGKKHQPNRPKNSKRNGPVRTTPKHSNDKNGARHAQKQKKWRTKQCLAERLSAEDELKRLGVRYVPQKKQLPDVGCHQVNPVRRPQDLVPGAPGNPCAAGNDDEKEPEIERVGEVDQVLKRFPDQKEGVVVRSLVRGEPDHAIPRDAPEPGAQCVKPGVPVSPREPVAQRYRWIDEVRGGTKGKRLKPGAPRQPGAQRYSWIDKVRGGTTPRQPGAQV